jgi:hypothetical protein
MMPACTPPHKERRHNEESLGMRKWRLLLQADNEAQDVCGGKNVPMTFKARFSETKL